MISHGRSIAFQTAEVAIPRQLFQEILRVIAELRPKPLPVRGSSGGTGAGLAANFAIAGIGTDTINSIRSPSSANSVVGIRPTLGLVSRAGVIPYSFTQDAAGPLARTITDAAKMLNVLVGYDPNDPATAWSVGNIEKDYTKFLKADGVKDKRIGVLRSFFGNGPTNEEVNTIANKAIEDRGG